MRLLLCAAILLPGPAAAQVRSVPPAAGLRAANPGRQLPALPAARLAPALVELAPAALTPAFSPLAPIVLPAPGDGPGSLTPAGAAAELAARLRGSEVILIQAHAGPDGRRTGGYEVEKKVEELIKAREGQLRSLSADGPANIFADTFAVEVRPEHKEEVLAALSAIEGADVRSLSRLIELGSKRSVTQQLPDAETLKGYAARIKDGPIEQRWQAFGELASMLENATPEAIAALPAGVRDELVFPLYGIAEDTVNAFNMVQGSQRIALRKSFLDVKANQDGWGAVENGASQALQHPELRARILPLRENLTRTLAAIDRLDTPRARGALRQILPHAEYAGLEYLSAPERASRYVQGWLAELEASIAEMKEGLLAPEPADGEKSPWTGSSRSGGYTHVEGRRQAVHLYRWRPYRFDPAESKNELLLLMGMPQSGASIASPLLAVLERFAAAWPELQELHKRKTLGREYAKAEKTLEYYKRQYLAQTGQEYTPEQVAQIRSGLISQVDESFERHEKLDGHAVIDRLLLSFGFYNSYAGTIPGFDAAAYVANVLAFLNGAAERINDRSIVAQLADGALHFLTSIADSDVLKARPDLRGQATQTWRALSQKADALGITLNTRLDGVIDPRPELRGEDPQFLEHAGGDGTVWQLAPSPDGNFIAQASGDRRIRIWNALSKKLVSTIELDDARQLYGDLANSLGVAWDSGRLIVTTLHDEKVDGKSRAYNLIRSFDPLAKPVQTPADATGEARVDDAYVLRERADSDFGPFYASPKELRNEQGHYLGAEVRLVSGDGSELAQVKNADLLHLKGDRLLTRAPGRSQPALQLWDVSKPMSPQDATPQWLKARVEQWKQRNPASEYGWWPSIHARLGDYQGRPALLWWDQGQVTFYDLQTGAVLRAITVPSGWNIGPFLTNADGTRLAAIVSAPGQFAGPNPERIVAWNLATGELILDRDTTYVPTGWLYQRGQAIAKLEFSSDGRTLVAAGRTGVQLIGLP